MPNKVEEILYSLLPLVLILVVSWAFGFLGRRFKKPDEDEAQPEKDGSKGLADILFRQSDADEPTQMVPEKDKAASAYEVVVGRRTHYQGGPKITSDPIRPKWWGA